MVDYSAGFLIVIITIITLQIKKIPKRDGQKERESTRIGHVTLIAAWGDWIGLDLSVWSPRESFVFFRVNGRELK